MSNNNPHSHINQTAQNSWNPLQIPSYIPRQPQLAHMSNERPMVRSPLAWHAAAPPPDSLYNFMSAANHKNLEHSMNPLLPPYVRGPPPFDSMDLSLQSNRSAASPLNKNAHTLLPAPPPQLDYGHKLQQQQQQHNLQQQSQQQMHAPSGYPIHNLSTNSPQSQQHSNAGMPNVSTASATPSATSPAQNNAKFLSANGSDCEQSASLIQAAQNTQSMGANNGNYMRDSYGKISHINRAFDNDPHSKTLQKPVELVNKDCNYSGMMSNKMPSHLQQQQHTTKKHSPLRSGNNTGSYHVSQAQAQQQQQQQQQSPFNSPATAIKHNGPHTPPTPQSPSMHQTQQQQQSANAGNNATPQQQQQHQAMLHGGNNNANLINYNQLHLQQQQQHNNYQQSPHLQQQHLHHVYSTQQQQQQPQQHQPPHHHTHHQHWQQQQHMSPHPPPMPPQSPMQPPPFNSPLHPQQQATQQNTLTNLKPASPATPNYALNADSNFEQQQQCSHEQHPSAATTTGAAASNSPVNRMPQNIPDSAESPTTNASSNDDDSTDGQHVGNKPPRTPPPLPPVKAKRGSNSPASRKNSPSNSNKTLAPDSLTAALNKSPKSSTNVFHKKSPRKADIHSPESLDLSAKPIASPVSVITASPQRTLTPQRTVITPTGNAEDSQTSQMANDNIEKLKNGHTPPVETHEIADDQTGNDEVETIDKIAEMIAKTTSNSSSQHSRCSNSNDALSNASSKSARTESRCESPKTKKQRQALKLRNSAAEQSTQDWSTNLYSEAAVGATAGAQPTPTTTLTAAKTTNSSPLIGNNDDNAVLAEELRKPLALTGGTGTPQHKALATLDKQGPLSPQSNSRSSSSTSSSSSCSNSTRSSYGRKSKESTNVTATESIGLELPAAAAATTHFFTNVGNAVKAHPNQTALNLNCKANPMADGKATKAMETPTSPDKSKFEEVENKLQEMFAGIEDEPILIEDDKPESECIKTPASDQIATDLSVALELSNSLSDIPAATTKPTITPPVVTPAQMPIQTKAAKKSTAPSPIKPATPPPEAPTTNKTSNEQHTLNATAPLPPRKVMPRRRLSMALDATNLRIRLEDKTAEAANNDVICILDDERPSTSAAAAAAAAAAAPANNSSEDSNKQMKTKNNNNNSNSSKGGKSNVNKSGSGKSGNSSGAGGSGGGGKFGTKTNAKRSRSNQQKQAQQKRRKQQSSSEDELPSAPSGRDANNSTTVAANSAVNEKYKSPFILIKRDGSISVVNAATAEDLNNDKQTKGKKAPLSYAHHERRRIRGFHSSTLSQKYDADTTDSTWICVFCKRGPHRMGLGDLFGPYLVSVDCEEYKNATNAPDALNIDEEFVNKRKRIDMVQSSARGPPVVMAMKAQEALAAAVAPGNNRTNKKKKKSIDEPPVHAATIVIQDDPLDVSNETFSGMTKVSENTFEVWLHEDCTVWAPDVYLVGARISGLDAAVWNSTRYQCVICSKTGATVCCLKRDCKAAAHIPCARESLWSLDESDCHVHCQMHTPGHEQLNNNSNDNTNQKQQNINRPQQQQQSTTPSQHPKNS